MGTGSLQEVKSGRGVRLTPHPLLVPWSRKGRAIPLLPLWTVRPVQSLSACTRVQFTLPQCLYKGALYLFIYEGRWTQVKVKPSHYRPGQAHRVPGGWGFQISRQSTHEGGKVVTPTHRPLLPPRKSLLLLSVRGWVDLRAIVGPEGLCQWKIPMTDGLKRRRKFWEGGGRVRGKGRNPLPNFFLLTFFGCWNEEGQINKSGVRVGDTGVCVIKDWFKTVSPLFLTWPLRKFPNTHCRFWRNPCPD